MSESTFEDAEQGPLLTEARKTVVQVRHKDYSPWLPYFAALPFDVLAWANATEASLAAAESARLLRLRMQSLYEKESADTRRAVDDLDVFFFELDSAINFRETLEPGKFAELRALMTRHDTSVDSFLNSLDSFGAISQWFDEMATAATDLGDPTLFVRANALLATLRKERDEADVALIRRAAATVHARAQIDAVRKAMIQFENARVYAMSKPQPNGQKIEIPGFDLAVIKGAAANPPPRPQASQTSATGLV